MAAGLADAVRALVNDKGISEDLIHKIIEEFLLAAYKRKFGEDENAVVQFSDGGDEVTLYAQKKIVEEVDDPVTEIALSEALKMNEECEINDELLIEIDPTTFDRVSIQSAKQRARQRIREIQKDTLYSEYGDKVGELVIGYVQRERNGNIFVDLGKAEGILPKRYQSPREIYRPNDRIKVLIVEVEKQNAGLSIVLSRTHTELVRRIFEIEVPEVYNRTVEITRIVREPGYRTKIAVSSMREDVDPVGACVGLRGVRIQAIVRELEGEKIDILKYDPDPRVFIKNALSPAEVSNVVVLEEAKKQSLAIVPETQLSLAIGKQGLNVRLANRLADWSIDVKTEAQFVEMDIAEDKKREFSALFDEEDVEEEITTVGELPGISRRLVSVLERNSVTLIEDVIALPDEELSKLNGMDPELITELQRIIAENVEIVEADEGETEAQVEEEEGSRDAETEVSIPEEADEAEGEPEDEEEEVITSIDDLPGMTPEIAAKLKDAGVSDLDELVQLDPDALTELEGLTEAELETVRTILTENVEIVEEDEADE